jgi:hypothetical protein
LAKLVLQVIGFVEGDHYFPVLRIMKNKVWNQLTNVHLEVVSFTYLAIKNFK